MIGSQALFSAGSKEWGTPLSFFDRLDAEFQFTIDVCASPENTKCRRFYSKADNGLIQDWGGERVWCNPSYGRDITDWVAKAYLESRKPHTVVVLLVPARTDTQWFHDYVYHHAGDIRFVRGRLIFEGARFNAPFPVMVVVFGEHP